MNGERVDSEVRRLLTDARPEMEQGWQHEARAAVVEAQAQRARSKTGVSVRRRLVYAIGALALGLVLYRPAVRLITPGPPLVTVAGVRGSATDHRGHALSLGDRLPADSVIRTGAGGRVTLFTRRGTELTLNAGSELALRRDGRRADLRRGEVYCRNREHELAQIRTPGGRIELLGTELDAAVRDERATAVTVIEGKIRLANAHGDAVVPAGRRALLTAAERPDSGSPITSTAELAWYDGRFSVVSGQGQIAYTVTRASSPILEVWAMDTDGTGKHLVKSYLGSYGRDAGQWLGDSSWIAISTEHNFLFAQMRGATWLLNGDTGEELRLELPPLFIARQTIVSPDGHYVAFIGADQTASDRRAWTYGVFLYDLEHDLFRQLYQGSVAGHHIAWAPDSRHVLASLGEKYSVLAQPLALIDVDTGEVQDLGVYGTDASFSPDGTQVAYCGDFPTGSHVFRDGTPDGGSVFVFDLPTGVTRRINPRGAGGHRSVWSTDGRRVAYWEVEDRPNDNRALSLHVAPTDGSGPVQVYRTEGYAWVQRLAWAPSGDALYAVISSGPDPHSGGVLVIAADGSGVIADLGGNAGDSQFTHEQQAEFDVAYGHLTSATARQCLNAEHIRMDGRLREARGAFRSFADLVSGLLWTAPHLNFSAQDLLSYADVATAEASRPDAEVFSEVCQDRIGSLADRLIDETARSGQWPSQTWFLEHTLGPLRPDPLGPGNYSPDMYFRCPVGDETGADHPIAYTYAAPRAGKDPAVGDVIASCPVHHYRLVWTKHMQQMLDHQRQRESERTEAFAQTGGKARQPRQDDMRAEPSTES